jgi:NADH dehydrogenase [ubiquinone] 1 alpha subcomplex assembly factor 3
LLGLVLPGACIFLAGRVFLWDIPTPNERWSNVGLEHFEVFDVVIPKPGAGSFDSRYHEADMFSPWPELLLIGTGKSAMLPPPKFRDYLGKIGVQVDIMDTVGITLWNPSFLF